MDIMVKTVDLTDFGRRDCYGGEDTEGKVMDAKNILNVTKSDCDNLFELVVDTFEGVYYFYSEDKSEVEKKYKDIMTAMPPRDNFEMDSPPEGD